MYFATDGSYGDATDMLIVDTDPLTQEDLDDIVNASDNGRLQLVQSRVSCMGLPDVAEDIGLSGSHETPDPKQARAQLNAAYFAVVGGNETNAFRHVTNLIACNKQLAIAMFEYLHAVHPELSNG